MYAPYVEPLCSAAVPVCSNTPKQRSSIKLCEGDILFVTREKSPLPVLLATLRVEELSVKASSFRWVIVTGDNQIFEGNAQSSSLVQGVDVKPVLPLVWYPSRRGLRVGFTVWTPPGVQLVREIRADIAA